MNAYHFVQGGSQALEAVLAHGEILPASMRLDPEAIWLKCEEMMGGIEYASDLDPGKRVASLGLRMMIEERLAVLSRSSSGETEETKFRCEDLLAGDLDFVFLSLGGWETGLFRPMPEEKLIRNGLVFDAKDLLEMGARLRHYDYFEGYELAITELVWFAKPRSPEHAIRILERKFMEIKDQELAGRAAIENLGFYAKRGGELVHAGPLPTKWAVEIWKDGLLEASREGRAR